MGPVAGRYAESTRAAFVLHMLDEHIHHAAEAALLATCTPPPSPPRLLPRRSGRWWRVDAPATPTSRRCAERPDLVRWAAANGHWRAVPVLVGLGFDIDAESDGATALHHAAAAGETVVAQLLVAHGADPARQDATFHATPAELGRVLRARGGGRRTAARLTPIASRDADEEVTAMADTCTHLDAVHE